MQKFYKRVGKLSPIARRKGQNTTNLRRIAKIYIDSESLLFERLRKKYGLKSIDGKAGSSTSKSRRRLLIHHTLPEILEDLINTFSVNNRSSNNKSVLTLNRKNNGSNSDGTKKKEKRVINSSANTTIIL